MKSVTINQFLNEDQLKKAINLKKAKDICTHIIKPNIKEINERLGQENDPMYLAYMVEYVLLKSGVFDE